MCLATKARLGRRAALLGRYRRGLSRRTAANRPQLAA